MVLYKASDQNKVAVIAIEDKVKITYSTPDRIESKKIKIKDIDSDYLISYKDEKISVKKIETIKIKTAGKSNKNEGTLILLFGASQAAGYYALDTYGSNSGGNSILKMFAGFGAIVATSYGTINIINGIAKSNRKYDLVNTWIGEIETKKYHEPQKPQLIR